MTKRQKSEEPEFIPEKTIRIALSGDVLVTETEQKIIDTSAFQRLRRIKQLGTSYLVYPSAMHTRFEHSLGTLKMADFMVQKIRDSVKIHEAKGEKNLPSISENDKQIIRLAALLHDITQIPFGHTLEDESHVIEPDHDSDKDRFKYFLGKDRDIGKILLDRIGEEGYNLLIKVLETKRVDIESLGDKAYISDIVKNTVCADLLDYLRRDAYYCNLNLDFGDRFLNFLLLKSVKSTKPEGKDSIRLVIRVWKEKEKKHRRDLIDELIQLLNCRFFLGSAVYFHHAKEITSAMISRATKEALGSVFTKEELWNMGDDELLYRFCTSNNTVAKRLAEFLLNRTLYEDFDEFTRAQAESYEQMDLLDILEKELHEDSNNRTNEENKLSKICEEVGVGDGKGDVLIYCPDKKMQLKMAEMLILWRQKNIPLSQVQDKLIKQKIESILESHKQLWSLKVFVSPKLAQQLKERGHSNLMIACAELSKRHVNGRYGVVLNQMSMFHQK